MTDDVDTTQFRVNKRAVRMFMASEGIVTMKQLTGATGLTQLTLRRLLAGEPFTSDTIKKLAKGLKCNPLDLLETEGYPDPHLVAPAFATLN